MKIQVSLLGMMLCVCVATAVQAQTLTTSGPYVAVTDRNVYPKPPLPALGPAGTTITDPVFQSAITRVTDGATRPGHLNYSFRTTSSPHQNEWSANGSYFYVISDDGTVIPFQFDEQTGTASRINPDTSSNGGMTLLTYIEPQFSYVNDSIIYIGYSGSGTNLHMIDQYDFSTGLYTQLVNLENVVTGLSGTYIGGIASSAGPTERVETFFGGTSQDHHHYVLVFDRANPSNRLLLDTWASTVNGQPTPITLNFSLHHAMIDRSGRYVMLYTTSADQSGTRQAPQSYVWDTETGSFFAMVPAVHPYGHDALGYGVSVNADCCTSTTWDAAQWQFRSLSAPAVTRDLLPTVISPKEIYMADHTTWNNASPTALVPYVSATYRYGDNTAPWRPLDDEIFAIETDVPGQNPTIWRFAHHRSDVSYDGNPTAVAFWYEPRPNISDDGKWVLFTSNWEKTLGADPKGDAGTGARQDVFLVRLRTASQTVNISTPALPSGRDNVAYSAALQATGGSGAYVWSVTAGALPAGLVLDPSSGALTGVPTVAGTFLVTISAADAAAPSNSGAARYTMTIEPTAIHVATASLPSGRATVGYTATLQAFGGSGGTAWTVASGVLPPGLLLDPASGVIAGTPTSAGSFGFTVVVTDTADGSNTASAPMTIAIGPAPLAIAPTALPAGHVGVAYTALLQALGGSGSAMWSLAGGSLPAGLALNTATGAIAGTPQTLGHYGFTIALTDAADPTNVATASLSIDVLSLASDVVLDARNLSAIQGRWQIVPDALHGTVLAEPDQGEAKIAVPFAVPANYFEMTFQADAGVPYHLWIHGLAQGDSYLNDSVWVQFSDSVDSLGAPIDRIGTTDGTFVSLEPCSACGEQGWGWRDNQYGGGLGPDIVFAATGLHTIRIQQREDGFTIGQVVLSPARYLTTAPGAARNDQTVVPAVTPAPPIDEIVLWASADSHSTNGTWSALADSSAAGGTALANPDLNQKASKPSASPKNYFDVTFNADAGKPYYLWLRMKADGDSFQNDSVWVQFSGSVDAAGNPDSRIGTTDGVSITLSECNGCAERGWGWQDSGYGSPGLVGAPFYFAKSGAQTIRIQVREDGMSIDQIVLSARQYTTAAPGAAIKDATILKRTQ